MPNPAFKSSNFDPNHVAEERGRRAIRRAETKTVADDLERQRKVVRATIFSHLRAKGMPIGAAQIEAEAHKDYREHLARQRSAEHAANLAWAELSTYDNWIELVRTKSADRRAEMKL